MRSHELAQLGMLAAVGIVLQLANEVIGFKSPFGMTVDLVGVPIILALFMFGFEASLYVAAVIALVITFLAPTSWIGATTKFAATMPFPIVAAFVVLARRISVVGRGIGVILVPGAITLLLVLVAGNAYLSLQKAGVVSGMLLGILPILLPFVVLLGLAEVGKLYARGDPNFFNFRILSNFPVFVIVLLIAILVRGIAMTMANYYYAGPIFWGMSTEKLMVLFPWWLIFGWNAIQCVIEAIVAWVLAYRYGLVRYGAR